MAGVQDTTIVEISYSDLHTALGLPDWIELVASEASQINQSLTLVVRVPSAVMQHDAAGVPLPLGYTLNTHDCGLDITGFIGNPNPNILSDKIEVIAE